MQVLHLFKLLSWRLVRALRLVYIVSLGWVLLNIVERWMTVALALTLNALTNLELLVIMLS